MTILEALEPVLGVSAILVATFAWYGIYQQIAPRSKRLAAMNATAIMSAALFVAALVGDAAAAAYKPWGHVVISEVGRTCNCGVLVCHSLSVFHTLFPNVGTSRALPRPVPPLGVEI
jgi:hypothetical protein